MKSLFNIVGMGLLLSFGASTSIALEAPGQAMSQLPFKVEITAIAQSDRGCCVIHGNDVRCAYTSSQYCEVQAKKAGVRFDFHKGTSCRKIKSCPAR